MLLQKQSKLHQDLNKDTICIVNSCGDAKKDRDILKKRLGKILMNNSLINQAFKIAKNENRPALLTYTVAGDNNKKKSLEILKSISKYADICELGFPHNTPIADGGQIQTSAYRAIKNGIKINDVFSIVSQFKKAKKKNQLF